MGVFDTKLDELKRVATGECPECDRYKDKIEDYKTEVENLVELVDDYKDRLKLLEVERDEAQDEIDSASVLIVFSSEIVEFLDGGPRPDLSNLDKIRVALRNLGHFVKAV